MATAAAMGWFADAAAVLPARQKREAADEVGSDIPWKVFTFDLILRISRILLKVGK